MNANRARIVAEIGVNHNGSPETAARLIDAAAEAGADAVKFQAFRADALAVPDAALAPYQQRRAAADSATQFGLLNGLQLQDDDFRELRRHCRNRNVAFLATPFDEESLELLLELDVAAVKIASGEAANLPFLLTIARTGKPVILSTGMCTLGDIESALATLAFGRVAPPDSRPTEQALREVYASANGRMALAGRTTLLHAVSEYPTAFADANLRAMGTLAAAFGLPVGLSDHTPGIAVPIAAAALGAVVIEKHLTLDCRQDGPDHAASLEPEDFARMTTAVRQAEAALGSPGKAPTPGELANAAVVRRSIVAASPIAAGERFTERNLALKRPAGGLSPDRYWGLLGAQADRDYAKDEPIR